MPTLATVLGCIIGAFILTVLVGRFIRAGGGVSDPAEELEALEKRQVTREDGWIADLEYAVAEQRKYLTYLRTQEPTTKNIDARGAVIVSIGTAERALAFLYARRDRPMPEDRRENAASFLEGRM